MKKSILLKGLTLSCFATLLVAFVLYRSGKLDSYVYGTETATLQGSPNGGTIKNTGKADSTTKKKAPPKTRMSGSKSMVVTDEIMPSSKSGAVFTPRPANDSARKDSAAKVTPQQKK